MNVQHINLLRVPQTINTMRTTVPVIGQSQVLTKSHESPNLFFSSYLFFKGLSGVNVQQINLVRGPQTVNAVRTATDPIITQSQVAIYKLAIYEFKMLYSNSYMFFRLFQL